MFHSQSSPRGREAHHPPIGGCISFTPRNDTFDTPISFALFTKARQILPTAHGKDSWPDPGSLLVLHFLEIGIDNPIHAATLRCLTALRVCRPVHGFPQFHA
ncbi:MAG: hypothetical protein FD153_446 [Rhodospirillaceae bacterium]|nr:MAG: hypothetical protein FD153_446 [Rhodospirillaceae bacterium]